MAGVRTLKLGAIWWVGDGSRIGIWEDPWIPGSTSHRVISRQGQNILSSVSDLTDPRTGQWDVQLINQTFWLVDCQRILAIPLSDNVLEDFVAWEPTQTHTFSVRSAYHAEWNHQFGRRIYDCGGQGAMADHPIWKLIWDLRVPAKIKIFIWKTLHGALPCFVVLADRHVKFTLNVLDNYASASLSKAIPKKGGWSRPPLDSVKINVDAGFPCDELRGTAGVIIRDHAGDFVAAANARLDFVSDVASAEARAVKLGLLLATSLGCSRIILNADNAEIVGALNGMDKYYGPAVAIVEDCSQMLLDFTKCSVEYCCREANAVAHELAKMAWCSTPSSWAESPPPGILPLLCSLLFGWSFSRNQLQLNFWEKQLPQEALRSYPVPFFSASENAACCLMYV
ncbi:hypothetical protein BRADI_1g46382v3 [Brachypodium distachyon]|uniref:RNase H type-1 domain-containing protein n=1 Tax=Brachypodium distachyon TaxID=15368 RepID=A0A2K2DPN4_BRADI|nr:hypothetical protein BRADI_1g46382v3 [Brachypodium distachyon]